MKTPVTIHLSCIAAFTITTAWLANHILQTQEPSSYFVWLPLVMLVLAVSFFEIDEIANALWRENHSQIKASQRDQWHFRSYIERRQSILPYHGKERRTGGDRRINH